MKEFIEKTMHQKVELNEYDKINNFPLMYRVNYEFYIMKIEKQQCLLVKPKGETGLVILRKQQKRIEQLTGLVCVLYLTRMNYYSRDKMLEEGIPFIWENRQIYMPFLGILLNQNEAREIKPCSRVSFLTQKLLLTALYQNWKNVTVTLAAKELGVSKMSITRCFDEIECLEIPVLEKKGRTRMVNGMDKKEMWKIIEPFMRNPLLQEYYLEKDIAEELVMSGNSALSEFSLLSDNVYPTYAITKTELKTYGIKERKQVPRGETPGCIVQELGYLILFKDKTVIDPLTVFLLMGEEQEEPRVERALEEMLEEYVW